MFYLRQIRVAMWRSGGTNLNVILTVNGVIFSGFVAVAGGLVQSIPRLWNLADHIA